MPHDAPVRNPLDSSMGRLRGGSICAAIMMVVFLSVVTAFAGDSQLVLKARIKLYKAADATSIVYRYLDAGEPVTVLSKGEDGWMRVGTAYKFDTGKRMTGYINPDMAAKKAAAKSPSVPSTEKPAVTPVIPHVHSAESVPPSEITLVSTVPTCDAQLKALTEQKAALGKELDVQKNALAAANAAGADKDKAIEAIRAQAAESATKLAGLHASVEVEVFSLLAEKASTVKLRGFGSVRLVPLLDDYLVVIPPELSSQVNAFFAKIRKSVLVGKAGTYLICDRKYFVPAQSVLPVAATDSSKGVQP